MGNLYEELRGALHAVWQRRWIALAVAWCICLAGWLVVSQMPNKYESRARIFVQLRQIIPTDGTTALNQQKDLDRIRQTLTSAVNLEKVVRGTDLARTVATDRDVADRVAGLQAAIKLTAQQDNLFEITVTTQSGKLAKQIAQKLIDIFVETNLSDNRDQSSQSLDFMDQQLAERQKQLQDADSKRADFQAKFLGSLPGTGSIEDRVSAARTQLAQIQGDLAAAQSGLNVVNAQMAGTPANIAGSGGGAVAGPARARLQAIQGQIADARAKGYTDSHPDMIALKNQLAAAQSAAAREPVVSGGAAGASNPVYIGLQSMRADKQATVAALVQRKAQIEGDLNALSAKMAEAPGVAAEQGEIERQYQVLKTQYDQLLAQREQMKISSQAQNVADADKFNVVDPPTQPRAPTSPNRPLLLTGVLIAGLGAGVALAFALGKLTATFPTAAKLEKASGMSVIGSIGEVVTATQTAMRRKKLTLFAGGVAALGVAYVGLIGVEFLQRGMGA
ncbi:polysaccharide chain length determinant protein (PEP-CTERM system associated) [Sphingomonas kyeonggiensis]|uniref:Polysaccharide chain length determinant protein (PEP-CTERM system associated) n=1 Tax=Sphingomonas kyeonggiensis TaxID=1268553 RepID=A0A7W7NT08_9SPHN|nr:XrtA system polysaccharide chain length determinant [Sphingomonas kyeonggiensis]MBB4839462.1 polysaccharide chain length determinant protein (PEP-CTERM system associated) [Sphingomonas kyeonggiensis]